MLYRVQANKYVRAIFGLSFKVKAPIMMGNPYHASQEKQRASPSIGRAGGPSILRHHYVNYGLTKVVPALNRSNQKFPGAYAKRTIANLTTGFNRNVITQTGSKHSGNTSASIIVNGFKAQQLFKRHLSFTKYQPVLYRVQAKNTYVLFSGLVSK